MAVSRKPANDIKPSTDDEALEAYIKSGGSTAKAERVSESQEIRQSVSIPGRICQDLDTLRSNRLIKTSRSRWILEAVVEKIDRDAPK
jgi:hypothetical protein